jgi:hypothetical protein
MHDEVQIPLLTPDEHGRGEKMLSRVLKNLLGTWSYVTVFSAPGVSLGLIMAYVSLICGRPGVEFPVPIFVGMSIWAAWFSYYQRPHKVIERMRKRYDRWVKSELITAKHRSELMKDLFAWYKTESLASLPRDGKFPNLISRPAPEPESAGDST